MQENIHSNISHQVRHSEPKEQAEQKYNNQLIKSIFKDPFDPVADIISLDVCKYNTLEEFYEKYQNQATIIVNALVGHEKKDAWIIKLDSCRIIAQDRNDPIFCFYQVLAEVIKNKQHEITIAKRKSSMKSTSTTATKKILPSVRTEQSKVNSKLPANNMKTNTQTTYKKTCNLFSQLFKLVVIFQSKQQSIQLPKNNLKKEQNQLRDQQGYQGQYKYNKNKHD